MTREASRLLEEALQLGAEDRAKMAAQLLASLDEQQEDVRAAWAAEIKRRLAEADAEPAAPNPRLGSGLPRASPSP